MNAHARWEFWIDRGGTFTDFVARTPHGALKTLKLLSQHPIHGGDAVAVGVRQLMALAPGAPIPGDQIAAVKLGTTVATNALLERKGAPTLFITNAGFEDALIIGDQSRPDIFALAITRPAPLYARVATVSARRDAAGDIVTPLDEAAAVEALAHARDAGCEAAAICLMHACMAAEDEQSLAEHCEALGFGYVAASHRIDPLTKFVPRARTTLADAYVTPVLQRYVHALEAALNGAPLFLMTSAGGLQRADAVTGRDVLLSGPAGGVVGMAKTAQAAGHHRVLGFDMGGTSTDVSRFDGEEYERRRDTAIAGWTVRAPTIAVHTVAAGGGSVLQFDGERQRVGPQSAGAAPGPACYGLGGPAAVTDANMVLGRLDAQSFPSVFGPEGDAPLDEHAARARLQELANTAGAASVEAAAEGFLAIAVENMAQAVRQISVARGDDPRGYALASFGGAGGQLACWTAQRLGVRTVLVHPQASVLSALGVGLAPMRAGREGAVAGPLDEDTIAAAHQRRVAWGEALRAVVAAQGAPVAAIQVNAQARLRAGDADAVIPAPLSDLETMIRVFTDAHQRLFGYAPQEALQWDSLFIEAVAETETLAPAAPMSATTLQARDHRMFLNGAWRDCPLIPADDVREGDSLHGPALLVEPHSQIVVEPGWRAIRQADGMLTLQYDAAQGGAANGADSHQALNTHVDPVRLELFNRRFMAVAEEMGAALERTAASVNMKERLDFSCAVFDADGALVANAPHIPVHLGSMGASVRAALNAFPQLSAEDAVVTNAPDAGGTHLPDITVIAPVFVAAAPDGPSRRLFFVAARGHHADIGGVAPGSMPPFSKTLSDEGVVIAPALLVRDGVFQDEMMRNMLTSALLPARRPEQNLADLRAQWAACRRGAQRLQELVAAHGAAVVEAYLGHVQDNAEAAVRRVIARLTDGRARMRLDTGAEIHAALRVDPVNQTAIVDFAGASPAGDDNFNAPQAVAHAATLYVFRCLADADIPLNEGCLKPLDIRIPPGCLLDARPPAAVVAGNVETSQHVVDALFAAAGALAAGPGSMTNLTFGDATRQYYETLAGGAPAGPFGDGAPVVQTHMTNSRLTDPEILEQRFPIRVEAHGVRTGSGGAGTHAGGDGAVRRLRFLAPMEAALLATRRDTAPPGLAGGGDGRPGAQRRITAEGRCEELPGRFQRTFSPGDVLELETPGGGGWGAPKKPKSDGNDA